MKFCLSHFLSPRLKWIGFFFILVVSCFSGVHAQVPHDYTWSQVDLGSSAGLGLITKVTGTSYDHLYFVRSGLIYQWDKNSGTWGEMTSFTDYVASSGMAAASMISAVGNQLYVGASSNGFVGYFNGTSWSSSASGSSVNYNGAYAYEIQVNTGSGDVGQIVNVFARGTGRIFRFVDGEARSSPSQGSPVYTGGTRAWQDISGSPLDNAVWAVGQQSQIGYSSNSGRGGTWSAAQGPTTDANTSYSSVHVLNGQNVIVGGHSVGEGGSTGVWYTTDGGESWVDTGLVTGSNIFDVYATSLDSIWVVGSGGLASYYDGVSWSSFAQAAGIGATNVLQSIHVLENQIWISGRSIGSSESDSVMYTGIIPEPAHVGLAFGALLILALRFRQIRGK